MQARVALLRGGKPCLVEMLQQPHVGQRIQGDAAGQHQAACAGAAQQMVDDMDQRVLEHELRRGGLVEAILRIGAMMDILHAQHRIRIPQLFGLERLAQDFDQRGMVRILEGIAAPIAHRAIEPDFSTGAEMENLPEPRIIGIGGAVHVAPGGRAHVAALAGEPGPAALGRRNHAVERAE